MGLRSGTLDNSLHQGIAVGTVNQRRFLECFATCGQVHQAARWAKLNRQCHYLWMQQDPTYPPRFHQAELRAARMLEDEAVRRAHDGIRKAIRYKGKIVAYDVEYSDGLLLALLRAYQPDKFRDRSSVEHSASAVPEKITVVHVRPGDVVTQTPDAPAGPTQHPAIAAPAVSPADFVVDVEFCKAPEPEDVE